MNSTADATSLDSRLRGRWSNRFAALGDMFYTPLPAQGLPEPHWVAWSDSCARVLGDSSGQRFGLEIFSGNAVQAGMRPLASVYSGHQFGVWAGQLGDGRAHWLGEVETDHGAMELQLKGSGLTPYSRRGDGRAVLRSSIREFLGSEAMAALGIPTTRALCVTGSALPVRRETMETAAVVTRVSPSFIRFGHFEHFAHTAQDEAALRKLADFAMQAYFPECVHQPNPYQALLRTVVRNTAALIAQWQAVGFCHGVMNTDNMSILGLTLDYGPFGFLDSYNPHHICNHSDDQGRYAFSNQPPVALWNLHALAESLLPLIGKTEAGIEAAADALKAFQPEFEARFARLLQQKLGLSSTRVGDAELAAGLLDLMARSRADYTLTFRRLAQLPSTNNEPLHAVRDLFIDREAFDAWAALYRERLRAEDSADTERATRMNRVNPKFVLRNHMAEQAIQQASLGEFNEVARLLKVLEHPFDEQPEHAAYAELPPDWAQSIEVSCSS